MANGLTLPLHRIGYFDGDAGRGRAAPEFAVTERGTVVASPWMLGLFNPDLASRAWVVEGLEVARPLVHGDTLYYGPTRRNEREPSVLLEIDLSNGKLRRSERVAPAIPVSATGSTVLLAMGKKDDFALCAMDRTELKTCWRREARPGVGVVPSSGERYLVTEHSGTCVRCLDALTGRSLWEFVLPPHRLEAPGRGDRMRVGKGFPSVVVGDDRLIIVTQDWEVLTVSLDAGELISRGRPPFVGAYLVTRESIYFKQPFGLSEFRHGEMREAERLEYRGIVEPLYDGAEPTASSLWLTEETILWTAMHGALMGVSRGLKDGKRQAWKDAIPGAIMPLARYPVGFGDLLYYSALSDSMNGPYGLYCYRAG